MKLYDLARMTVSGTPGTGTTINLLAAATGGYLTFAQANVPDGAKISYGIKDGTSLEVGRATYSSAGPSLLNRAPILVTGGGNSPLSLTSAAVVGIVALAQDFEEELPILGQLLGTNNSTAAEVETTKALRVSLRMMASADPPFQIGRYAIGVEATWAAGAATAIPQALFWQAGMPICPGLALLNKLQVQMVTSAISGARNGNARIDLRQYDSVYFATTGLQVLGFAQLNNYNGSVTGAKNPLRSLGTFDPYMHMWSSANGGLLQSTITTRSPILISSIMGGVGQAAGNNMPLTTMFDAMRDGGYNPLLFQAHGGVGLEATVPAAVTSQTVNWAINMVWDEYIPTLDIR